MPIDQARGNRAAARINDTVGIALFEANNYAVFDQQAIAVGNGLIQITRQQKANVTDQNASGFGCVFGCVSHWSLLKIAAL
jgi:hypothetical protein